MRKCLLLPFLAIFAFSPVLAQSPDAQSMLDVMNPLVYQDTPIVDYTRGAINCETDENLIINDDDSVENGYSGNPEVVTQVRFVDYYTPYFYPAKFEHVCVVLLTLANGPGGYPFDAIFYEDAGGMPGAELGRVSGFAEPLNQPPIPFPQNFWSSVDVSELGITLEDGGIFIGVEYAPNPGDAANVFIGSDESVDTTPAGGFWWNDNAGAWAEIGLAYPNYRALFVRPSAVKDVSNEGDGDATATMLNQNAPNPFFGTTNISFELPASGDVTVTVYDLTGRQVAEVANGHYAAGSHSIMFDGSSLASGTYVYQLRTMDAVQTKRFTVVN